LSVILVHPPISKPSEPPAGIARLAGALKKHGLSRNVVEANLEGILNLLQKPAATFDTWTSRAYHHLPGHLRFLKTPEGYENPDRYRRAVVDINRVLEKSIPGSPVRVSLANCSDKALSSLRSEDLLSMAERPELSPFCTHFQQRLRRILQEENPKVVGFSLNYLSQALSTFSMIGLVKQEHPRLRIMLGGGLVTSWMRRPGWKNPFHGLVGDLVAGPGEESILSVFGREGAGRGYTPDYDALAAKAYFSPGFILPYSASSGCYWQQCAFCPEKAEGNPYKPVHPEQAVGEVKSLAAKLHPILIHFLDNAMSPALLKEIAQQGLNTPWYGFVRFTHHLRTLDFCLALKHSGCVMLKLGLESGDQEVLDQLHKGIDLETASVVLRNLKKAGIGTYVYLLFGTPAETRERAGRTLDFTVRHGADIDFLNVAVFNMPAGGPGSEHFDPRPFYKGDLSLYTDFVHPSGWNRTLVRSFLDKEFKRHPVIAAILRRDPPSFTSNHAPFFVGGFPWRFAG
jgi:radical SAM superfamily enzyme YgiQ (UPF0313 family)